ncbi:hypothetical protein DA075_07950 [Methylobacterium currus]|uniref:Uncharacterized protein n=1 Tax=Methylobacterium currus TaxID=2051553 RepID=A0A2R4WH43_9HYPH|nr:MucR family transcriptional regulator [Methylobacterium currus]AWB20853.1 hypothetical protein DA075_07950 [Methylobacterium currus]
MTLDDLKPFQTREAVEDYLSGDRLKCLLCGKAFRGLGHHLPRAHGVSVEAYQDALGLPRSRGLVGSDTRARFSASVTKTREAGKLEEAQRSLVVGAQEASRASARVERRPYHRAMMREHALALSGRETPITDDEVTAVIRHVEAGATAYRACREVGISHTAFYAAMRSRPDLRCAFDAVRQNQNTGDSMNETLRRVGAALYGTQWQSDLARALNISDRQVRRWASGEGRVPAGVWSDIAALCEARMVEIADVRDRIRAEAAVVS